MHRESSRPQAELSGEHGRGKPTVHVSQPEGSIPADGLVPAPGRSTGLTLRGGSQGFLQGRLFPSLRRQEFARYAFPRPGVLRNPHGSAE